MGVQSFVVLFCVLYSLRAGAVSLDEANKRIKRCCAANGIEDCGVLCKYNQTEKTVITNGLQCLDKIRVWLYCASEGDDHIAACRSAGVPRKCLGFCKGDGPTICFDEKSVKAFRECALQSNLDKILKTHRDQLGRRAKWQKGHKFSEGRSCPS